MSSMLNGALTRPATRTAARAIPLRTMTAEALDSYFSTLNGHKPGQLYDLVLREVEEPLFKAVLDYAAGNQSRAAEILGINRGTLRNMNLCTSLVHMRQSVWRHAHIHRPAHDRLRLSHSPRHCST